MNSEFLNDLDTEWDDLIIDIYNNNKCDIQLVNDKDDTQFIEFVIYGNDKQLNNSFMSHNLFFKKTLLFKDYIEFKEFEFSNFGNIVYYSMDILYNGENIIMDDEKLTTISPDVIDKYIGANFSTILNTKTNVQHMKFCDIDITEKMDEIFNIDIISKMNDFIIKKTNGLIKIK